MTYLLDTCILSKLRKLKTKPDPDLENWIASHKESEYFLSVLTIGEIQQGIYKLKDNQNKRILDEWLFGYLIPRFEGRILPVTNQVCLKWGELSGSYQRQGICLPLADTLIAATSIVHNLILVTHNLQDFIRVKETKVFSPWEK